jgi:hypothetical protein
MAEGSPDRNSVGPTLWSLLFMACVILVVLHLVQVVRSDTSEGEDLVEATFTTLEAGR